MTLGEFVSIFLAEQRTECQLLEPERVLAQGVAAASFYCGWGHNDLVSFQAKELADSLTETAAAAADPLAELIGSTGSVAPKALIDPARGKPVPPVGLKAICPEMPITESDWALIRPLFLLYCEREQALMLESSRVMGVDVFGRATSEVQGDITAYESDLPRKAFIQPAFTI